MKKLILLNLIILASFFNLEAQQVQVSFDSQVNGSSVTFIPNINIPGATITSYHWTFGDGESSSDESPTHPYRPSFYGTFHVILEITYNLHSVRGLNAYDINQVLSASDYVTIASPDVLFRETSDLNPRIDISEGSVFSAGVGILIPCYINAAYQNDTYNWELRINGKKVDEALTSNTNYHQFIINKVAGVYSIQLKVINSTRQEIFASGKLVNIRTH